MRPKKILSTIIGVVVVAFLALALVESMVDERTNRCVGPQEVHGINSIPNGKGGFISLPTTATSCDHWEKRK